MNETLKTIFARCSVRSFTGQKVKEEDVEMLLRAAMAAPSAKNGRPWRFVVIDDREAMAALAKALPYAKMLETAPLAIAICGEPAASPTTSKEMWIQDCSAATENLLLAAVSLGLGACWTAAWPYPERYGAVTEALGLPEGIVPLNVIPVGYPAENRPKEKFDPALVHRNKW